MRKQDNNLSVIEIIEARVEAFFDTMLDGVQNIDEIKADIQEELDKIKNSSDCDSRANEYARLVQEKYGHIIDVYKKLNDDSNNFKKIAGWVTFLGIVTLVGLVLGLFAASKFF